MMQRHVTVWILAAMAILTTGCLPIAEEGDPNYTILLAAVSGPIHVDTVRDMKQDVEARTEWDDLFVLHEDGMSYLYKGEYVSINGARWDLRKVHRFKIEKIKPFERAMTVALPSTLIGPPEYDLTRARGTYTLVVAKFYDVPKQGYIGRQRYAIDHCKNLREEGHDAFYYHSGVNSYVTVGNFPESAYRMGISDNDVPTKDIVYDPKLAKLMEDFRALAVNGNVEYQIITSRRGTAGQKRTSISYIMKIPKRPSDYVD